MFVTVDELFSHGSVSLYKGVIRRVWRTRWKLCSDACPSSLTLSEGVISLDDLRDFWWVSCRMARLQYGAKNPRKVKPLSSVHARHRRQTDGFVMPYH